jgi:hypothetical protein
MIVCVSLQLVNANVETVLKLCYETRLPHPLQLIFLNHPIIGAHGSVVG